MRTFIRNLLPYLAKAHWKNWRNGRMDYPQLWYCWPRFTKRVKWIYAIRTALCGLVTGHELSKTEWGYGGGKCADHWCRWCDKLIQIPISESPPPSPLLQDLLDESGLK